MLAALALVLFEIDSDLGVSARVSKPERDQLITAAAAKPKVLQVDGIGDSRRNAHDDRRHRPARAV